MPGQTATTGSSTGSYDASLKDFYEGMIRRILNRQARLYAYAKRGTKTISGKKVVFPVNTRGSSSIAATIGGATLPAAVAQTTVDATIPMQEVWGRIQVNVDVIEQARDNRGAFERPIALEVSRIAEDFVDRVNIWAFGDGTGKIGEVAANVAAVAPGATMTITLKNVSTGAATGTGVNGNQGARYVKVGDVLAFLDTTFSRTAGITAGNGRPQRATVATVVPGTAGTDTITVTFTAADVGTNGQLTATDGMYFSTQDQAGSGTAGANLLPQTSATVSTAPMGLGGIVDDGSFQPTFQSILRSANVRWSANAISLGASAVAPGALSLDVMQRAVDIANETGLGFPGVALCHHSVRREYIKLVQTDRRYTEPYKYEPGIDESHLENWPWKTTLSFDGFPLAFDKHCQWQTMYFLDPRVLRKWVWKDFHWVRNGRNGGDTMYLLPGVSGTLEAQCAMFFNFGTDEVSPSSCTVLKNISSTIDRYVDA